LVQELLAESSSWAAGHWLYAAEHSTRERMMAAGRLVLAMLIAGQGTGHEGQSHRDASGQERRFKEYRRKHVQTLLGPVSVERASYHSMAAVPTTVCPLDARLGLRQGRSEGIEELLAFTGGQLTYRETSELLCRTLGVRLSDNTVQRTVEHWGQVVATERVDRLPRQAPAPRMAVAVDGAKLRTAERRRKRRGSRKQHFSEHWAEAKLGVVYAFDRRGKAAAAKHYTASLNGKDSFGQALWDQIAASGADRAEHVVWLGDGAAWVWSLRDEHLPHAVAVLDFYHARDHLHTVARTLWSGDRRRRRRWVTTQERRLLTGHVDRVVRELTRRAHALGPPPGGAADDDPRKVLADNVRYFETNASRMQYDEYRARGYPIGSGVVESGCKHVVAQRMKITASMSWSRRRADAVLQLRCLIRSGQWDTFWNLKRRVA
jgi:hypothetical protein